ncbi:MAG: hypothetical protein M1818_000903 [Claussenomyces sp. TS43310]|nr:MAG: hypothetical protein M1818_000903 [Claussenomyces sp. TS43310]
MAILSNFYSFALPFVLVFSIPLAIFAAITSTFAISILLFRVLLVYAELAVAVIPQYIFGLGVKSFPAGQTIRASRPHSPAAVRRRKRRSSGGSSAASDGLTPVASEANLGLLYPFSTSIGPQRDFEGVGGWRLDAADEDELWTSINSRLELPTDHVRRHQRALTGSSCYRSPRSNSPEKDRMPGVSSAAVAEPNTSKTRTPLEATARERTQDPSFEGASQPASPKTAKRVLGVGTSASGSNAGSKGSGLNMKRF